MKTEVAWQYRNMKDAMDPVVVEAARQAYRKVGVEPVEHAIRGGTDGAFLTLGGLPTPNVFAGGHNFHSRAEFLPVRSLEKAAEVCLALVKEWAERLLAEQKQ